MLRLQKSLVVAAEHFAHVLYDINVVGAAVGIWMIWIGAGKYTPCWYKHLGSKGHFQW
jgi:hypothetical protein